MIKTFAKIGQIASESLYFHKKDRELIQKIKESNQLKEKRDAALKNAGYCSCCGEDTQQLAASTQFLRV